MKINALSELALELSMMAACMAIPTVMVRRRRGRTDARAVILAMTECLAIVLVLNAVASGLLVGKWMIHAKSNAFDPAGAALWLRVLVVKPMVVGTVFLMPLTGVAIVCDGRMVPAVLSVLLFVFIVVNYYIAVLDTIFFPFKYVELGFMRLLDPAGVPVWQAVLTCLGSMVVWTGLTVLLSGIVNRKKEAGT